MPLTFASAKPCPGCGRDRRDCWKMPCLHLQIIKKRGVLAVERWLRPGLPPELRASLRVTVSR